MDQQGRTGGERTSTEAEELFARYLALREAAATGEGPAPEFEAWVAAHPELEAELRALEQDLRGFDTLLGGALGSRRRLFHRSPPSGSRAGGLAVLNPGSRVDEFELVRRIGQGGMGEVWEARQAALDRDVALKFIRPDRATERSEAYFEREARAGGRLSHPGIVTLYGTGRAELAVRTGDAGGPGGTVVLHWISQELVPGASTLQDFLASVDGAASLPRPYFERVARFVGELCEALHAAHGAGVIHRDVKPQNILVTPDDRPKLTDFGLARLTNEAGLTGSRAVKGTPIYMSPEQALGKTELVDHRSDVFSVGAVLYEMLALRRPFEGDADEATARLFGSDPPSPRTVRPEVPPELAAIALKALARRPSERYSTAAAMADDLRRFLRHEPVRARPPGPLRRLEKWVRRHPTAASVVCLGLVAVVVGLLLESRVAEASEGRRAAERGMSLDRIVRAIDSGDVGEARERLAEFEALHPGDLRGSLVMALGYLRAVRLDDFERELARYAERSGPEPPRSGEWGEGLAGPGAEAMDVLLGALHWHARAGLAHPDVLPGYERAIELDPELELAYYPLYLSHKLLGRAEGAREVLLAFRGILRTSDPALPFVNGLLAELDGNVDRAVDWLRRARSQNGQEWFAQVFGHAELGRALLRSYVEDPAGQLARLSEAESELERALELRPGDYHAHSWIALVQLRKHDRTPSAAQRADRLERALAHAEAALEIEPRAAVAHECRAVALQGLLGRAQEGDQRRALRAELEGELAWLERDDPASRVVASARSDLLYADGVAARARGELANARELFEASAEAYELQFRGRIMWAQLVYADDPARSLEVLREALEVEARLRERGADDPGRWRFTLFVWLVGAADRAGDLDAALEYADAARGLLAEGAAAGLDELFTLAEFLAIPAHPELRDCDLVRRLFEEHSLAAAYGESYGTLVDEIRGACD